MGLQEGGISCFVSDQCIVALTPKSAETKHHAEFQILVQLCNI